MCSFGEDTVVGKVTIIEFAIQIMFEKHSTVKPKPPEFI
jgi:hypothetical protein